MTFFVVLVIFALFNALVQAEGQTKVPKFQAQSQMGNLTDDCYPDSFHMPFSTDCQMSFPSWPPSGASDYMQTANWHGISGLYNAYYSCSQNNNLYYKVCLTNSDWGNSYGDCNTEHKYGDASWKGPIKISSGGYVTLTVFDENDSDSGGITCTLEVSCPDQFTGKLCEIPVCNPPCLNGGSCVGQVGEKPTCECAPGWKGSDCSESQCDYRFCQNGGTCSGDNVCSCPTGWSGDDCSQNTCKEPCYNGGNCTGPDVCTCASGYSGAFCTDYLCAELGCDHGQCMGLNRCECDASWTIWGNDPACSGYLGMPQYAVVFGGLLVFFLSSYFFRLCWIAVRKRKDNQHTAIVQEPNYSALVPNDDV